MYRIVFSKQAIKDLSKLKQANLSDKARQLVALMEANPFATPPRYEKLVGNLNQFYSRRINIQHRMVYEVDQTEQVVKLLRMCTL